MKKKKKRKKKTIQLILTHQKNSEPFTRAFTKRLGSAL